MMDSVRRVDKDRREKRGALDDMAVMDLDYVGGPGEN